MFIKHKNMKDVMFKVENITSKHSAYNIEGIWYNQLGTYDHPAPFPMGTSSKPAYETLTIPIQEFFEDWKMVNENDPRAA